MSDDNAKPVSENDSGGSPCYAEQPLCAVCGKRAITWVRDVYRETFPDSDMIHNSPMGEGQFLCGEHDRKSETVEINYIFTASDGSSMLG
jgi:hypothetical protein